MEALQRGHMAASMLLDVIRHLTGVSQRELWIDG
jgi:hypothetical protein